MSKARLNPEEEEDARYLEERMAKKEGEETMREE